MITPAQLAPEHARSMARLIRTAMHVEPARRALAQRAVAASSPGNDELLLQIYATPLGEVLDLLAELDARAAQEGA